MLTVHMSFHVCLQVRERLRITLLLCARVALPLLLAGWQYVP